LFARVLTIADGARRCRAGVDDPLEDPSLTLTEKHRLASLWDMVLQNRHSPAQLLEGVRPMLVRGVQVAGSPDADHVALPISTGLQLACLYGDLNFVKMLVSRGENIDQVTMSPDNFGRGRCPMSVAAELGHNGVLSFLISAGGDARNMHDPPLRQAVRRNDLAAVTLLVQGGADPDPTLHQLLYPGCDANVVRMLLEAGARPSGTMLLTALWRGCEASIIELLLSYGAPFRSDLENESALEVAICRGANRRIVELLQRATSKWSPKTHFMFPKAFRERAQLVCLLNNRQEPRLRMPTAVVQRLVWWMSVAEKRDGDHRDLVVSICNSCDLSSLEQRVAGSGFAEVARRSEQSGNTSKGALLEGMSVDDLLRVLWFEDKPAVAPIAMAPQLIDSTARHKLMQSVGSESTLDSRLLEEEVPLDDDDNMREDDGGDEGPHVNEDSSPERNEMRRKRKLANGSSNGAAANGDVAAYAEIGALPPSVTAERSGGSGSTRRTAHPVADSRNPNSPKPHHCTCCHVCHVSMKQRPRPIAACAQCNTIICKLCLQDRWKNDQWDDACSSAGWM
jgi:hypothetical protein